MLGSRRWNFYDVSMPVSEISVIYYMYRPTEWHRNDLFVFTRNLQIINYYLSFIRIRYV